MLHTLPRGSCARSPLLPWDPCPTQILHTTGSRSRTSRTLQAEGPSSLSLKSKLLLWEKEKQPRGQKALTDLEQRRGCGQGRGEEDLAGIQVFKRTVCQQHQGTASGKRGWAWGERDSLGGRGGSAHSQGDYPAHRGHQHHD